MSIQAVLVWRRQDGGLVAQPEPGVRYIIRPHLVKGSGNRRNGYDLITQRGEESFTSWAGSQREAKNDAEIKYRPAVWGVVR